MGHIVIRTSQPSRQGLCWHFDVESNEMTPSAVADEGIQIPVIIECHRCMLPQPVAMQRIFDVEAWSLGVLAHPIPA
ncbi:hypothetical protein ACGFIE_30605 [Micromonospora sp. NPDC049275]|uniref:hypothetical protein n=1 Tax=unclassified Micromonospora TaxID=2617518 RepID=UPI00343A467B